MMYDDNPTLVGTEKKIDEHRQGEAFFPDHLAEAKEGKRFYIESYGCQMNFSDSEIVASVLSEIGYSPTRLLEESDLILINTCSIREKAEETVRKRLRLFDTVKRLRHEYSTFHPLSEIYEIAFNEILSKNNDKSSNLR